MPQTKVIFYQEADGTSPVVSWLNELRDCNKQAWAKCRVRIDQLAQMGHELRRPSADILREGIYELRMKQGRVQYRLLYFFHGRNIAILTHGLTKEDKVPESGIERAIKWKQVFESNPEKHTYAHEI